MTDVLRFRHEIFFAWCSWRLILSLRLVTWRWEVLEIPSYLHFVILREDGYYNCSQYINLNSLGKILDSSDSSLIIVDLWFNLFSEKVAGNFTGNDS